MPRDGFPTVVGHFLWLSEKLSLFPRACEVHLPAGSTRIWISGGSLAPKLCLICSQPLAAALQTATISRIGLAVPSRTPMMVSGWSISSGACHHISSLVMELFRGFVHWTFSGVHFFSWAMSSLRSLDHSLEVWVANSFLVSGLYIHFS